MLDSETKRHIDNARDILVGKVPNPQSQVDLITVALIYKFMDDMDLEAVDLGGKRSFFVKDLKNLAFSKIMDSKIGAQERMNFYAEVLEKLPFANSIPELFRSIFKGAFLPFRDPQTLTLFLKEIENFSYGNSENLGNAFEYLLSIMGSQGDAGQFRTPRHIIDFIVQVVNPKKTDSILDPACGTAGFLISAFLHVKSNNKNLSTEEMRKFTAGIAGYDISPDMRKLALVNLYLHKFAEPNVFEYDTLTSDDRWNEKFDVILANPPFMTPKGGIRPHNKFGVQANRSEVLFVDYIAEHLSAKGRAGIIVPEGIIFQSATAYKALRKMLVEDNYLWAVASLPAGVFQPYSGVKTSILFLDKKIAKSRDEILFVKIENDGFDLGAQRRKIEKNDLPEALEILKNFADTNAPPSAAHPAGKAGTPLGEGNYYTQKEGNFKTFDLRRFPFNPKLKFFAKENRKSDWLHESVFWERIKGKQICGLDFHRQQIIGNYIVDYFSPIGGIIIEIDGKSHEAKVEYDKIREEYLKSLGLTVIRISAKDALQNLDASIEYLKEEIKNIKEEKFPSPRGVPALPAGCAAEGGAFKCENAGSCTAQAVPKSKIAESGEYNLTASRYGNDKLKIGNGKYEVVKLGDVAELIRGITFGKKDQLENENDKTIRIATTKAAQEDGIVEKDLYFIPIKFVREDAKLLCDKDILISTANSLNLLGRTTFVTKLNYKCSFGAFMTLIRANKEKIEPLLLFYILRTNVAKSYFLNCANTTTNISNLSFSSLYSFQFPLPPLSIQKQIVEEIENKQQAIDNARRTIDLLERERESILQTYLTA